MSINRAILSHPEWLDDLDRFDYFNDSQDTIGWLRSVAHSKKGWLQDLGYTSETTLKLADKLEQNTEEWFKNWQAKISEQISKKEKDYQNE